jgi:hypothetical protein
MGRPINKRFFGRLPNADETAENPLNDTAMNIKANVKVGSNSVSESGYLIRQKTRNKFLVNDLKTGTKRKVGGSGTGNVGVCKLVNASPAALTADQMTIQGRLPSGVYINLAHFYNRTCRDFNNNRYKWTTVDDSTETYINLTAI